MARTSCNSSYHCRDGHPCQSCRSVLECPAPKMCNLSTEDQYVCQSNQGIAEAVTGVLGGAQFPSCPFYHPRSSRCRLGHPRETSVCAGNFPDSNGISDDFKRQKRSHQTEPVPLRHTRPLWVIYRDEGQLGANLAQRHILPIPRIVFTEQERQAYDQLETYCKGLAQQMAGRGGTQTK